MIKLRAVSTLLLLIFASALYAQGEFGKNNSLNKPVELKLQEKRGLELSGYTHNSAHFKKK